MNSADGDRLREVLADAVRLSRGFRKPAWTGPDQRRLKEKPVKPVSNSAGELCHELSDGGALKAYAYLSSLGADSQRLSEGGAFVLPCSRRQVDL